ncbi:N-acetyltransferase NDAI_0D02360 [Naumovozyma dairenensis CBS 421]|uniref:Condensation domain-containing protein n=1 Tax=Naumovozyma dairenensis (strain ATCC 10597 / BCRC 20456 / CBS 421 / NBRC 0211 / NRRL Y-12639) TaxID=1071378 RepID=G0W9T9_NAUDC|nr:hypothetical protein NDAI_0D02360 [Naumovozyma dairenensis CBS 421]CCD24550.1 hypothetical protein NDAI_0D02360 [Naumovozyma dairenensis CBS 421]
MMNPRELSSLENFFYHRSEVNLHSCFYLALLLNALPAKKQLYKALQDTIATYPQLHQNITKNKEDEYLYVEDIKKTPIEFEDVVEFVAWEKFEEKEINSIFQTYNFHYRNDRPLWKILVVPSLNTFILLLDHALFDGISAVKIWETFMEKLNKSSEIENIDVTVPLYIPEENHEGTLVASQHPYDIWPVPIAWKVKSFIATKLFNWYPQAIISPNSNLFEFKGYKFPEGFLSQYPKDGVTSFKVRNDNTQKLIKMAPGKLETILKNCKTNAVSLTSYIVAIIIIALRNVTQESYTGNLLKVSIPINTRNICANQVNTPEEMLQLGNFVGSMDFEHPINSDSGIWDIARDVQQFITKNTTVGISDIINNIKLLDGINCEEFVKKKIEFSSNGPASTFEVTNLGFQSFKGSCMESSSYFIKDAVFNEPQGMSDIFTCSVISTPIGGLRCSLSYPKDIAQEFEPCWDYIKNNF